MYAAGLSQDNPDEATRTLQGIEALQALELQDDPDSEGIFVPLDAIANDPSAWDDTALVEAYEAAIACYGPKYGDDQSQTQEYTVAAEPEEVGEQALESSVAHSGGGGAEGGEGVSDDAGGGGHAAAEGQALECGDGGELSHGVSTKGGSASATAGRSALFPPPPPPRLGASAGDKELEQLLMSWYEAGYRAGRYAARREAGMTE